MFYKILLIAILLYSYCYTKCLTQQEPLYAKKTSSQVSNLNIKAFCQDSLGYMWIATPRGLNRYNGHELSNTFMILPIPLLLI